MRLRIPAQRPMRRRPLVPGRVDIRSTCARIFKAADETCPSTTRPCVLDIRARAPTVLSFIEADEGKDASSDELRRASEKVRRR